MSQRNAAPTATTGSRALAISRMHLVDRLGLLGIPAAVLAAAALLSLAVMALVPEDGRGTGSAMSIYVAVGISGAVLVGQSMYLALGLGASRRAFTLGTGVTGALQAVLWGTVLWVLNRVEVLTEGWGLGAHLFSWPWLAQHVAGTWLLFTAGFLAAFLLGGWIAATWMRWQLVGMLVVLVAVILVLGGLAFVLTWQHAWADVGSWFAGLTPLTAAGWTALLSLVLAAAGHLTLRDVEL